MKILFTGRGTSGSWQVRGVQLSHALGAEAIPNACGTNADVVVLVKRIDDRTLRAMRASGAKLVWDCVDSWPQGKECNGNDWDEREAQDWLTAEVERIKPAALIAATAQMATDMQRFGLPVKWLRHHHRPRIKRNPIRERITVIGYEGATNYIKKWRDAIKQECQRIGASFVVNPDHLSDCDVILALRDSRGYAARNWKSAVKAENAHASGTPLICCSESGYLEIATGCEYWADSQHELRVALDWLADQSTREQICDRFIRAAYPVERAAADLSQFLHQCYG